MKVRKREIFDAEQWFPGKKVLGVQGADPKEWCGCVMAGGPPNIPHIHLTEDDECELVEQGDWVVTDAKGKRCLVKPGIFEEIYEKIKL
jgi:hypothetical protein